MPSKFTNSFSVKIKPIHALTWLLLVTVLLCLPGKALPDTGGNWFDRLYMDKWIHVFLFSVLVYLSCRAIPHSYAAFRGIILQYVIMAVVGVLYGVLIEFVQLWLISGRGFEEYDILADTAGCALGYIIGVRRSGSRNSDKQA